jgi:hypothetical protein
VIVASLDLSSAFDMVNTNLLIKGLKMVGLPDDDSKTDPFMSALMGQTPNCWTYFLER